MSGPWKPGDVALVTRPNDIEEPMVRANDGGWFAADGYFSASRNLTTRPLLIIDPENWQQVGALADAFCVARWSHIEGSSECDPLTRSSMQAALRSLLPTTKPEEPTGLGAVVVDSEGGNWVRIGRKGGNIWYQPHGKYFSWRDIDAVTVLSEGVRP